MFPSTTQLVALGATPANADKYGDHIADSCIHYHLTTVDRLAPFLGNVYHESLRLALARELWGPTKQQGRYEGRRDMGNTRPGDGFRYRGRGLIQVTFHNNYRDMRDHLRESVEGVPDFVIVPERLELPKWAAWSAAAFWDMHNLNALADKHEEESIARRINGGVNGLAERLALAQRARKVLA